MTAFSSKDIESPFGLLRWEMRSVNHRFCELNFKIPDNIRHLEGLLREIARRFLHRGKIDCHLKIEAVNGSQSDFTVNFDRVEKLVASSYDINEHLKKYQLNAPISPLDILKWPDILGTKAIDEKDLEVCMESSFTVLLEELKTARAREGEMIKSFIMEKLSKIQERVSTIRNYWQHNIHMYRDKFKEKIAELKINLDQNRLEQEILYLTQKSDISEEIERLQSHVKEVTRILLEGGIVGKKLDFFMQELNRETNTIAAKVMDTHCIQTAVDIKVLIEEMREQIQNLE